MNSEFMLRKTETVTELEHSGCLVAGDFKLLYLLYQAG